MGKSLVFFFDSRRSSSSLFMMSIHVFCMQIEVDKVFSNIGDVFYATCHFWVSHMGQVLRQARKTREVLDPCLLKAGFLVVRINMCYYTVPVARRRIASAPWRLKSKVLFAGKSGLAQVLLSPQKCPFPWGGLPVPIWFLASPHDFTSQPASRSVNSLSHGSLS